MKSSDTHSTPALIILGILVISLPGYFAATPLAQTDSPRQGEKEGAGERPSGKVGDDERSLAASCNKFSLNLFREAVAAAPDDENVFLSPLSASFALGLCYNGAKGQTREEIGNTLQLADSTDEELNQTYYNLTRNLMTADPAVELEIANSLWLHRDVRARPEFIDVAKSWFDATVKAVDFRDPATVNAINDWCSRATKGKITKMVESPPGDAVMSMLFNAIYFKGTWRYQFQESRTETDTFYLANGDETECRMMHLDANDCKSFEGDTDPDIIWHADDEVCLLSMPYGKKGFRMSIIVPHSVDGDWDSSGRRSIEDVITRLDSAKWKAWQIGNNPPRFSLSLPRFKFRCSKALNNSLSLLGMKAPFDRSRADFTNLFADTNGWIGLVKHDTFIRVDEEGTEAAAVTQITMVGSALETPPTPEIVCDRPFLIAIHEVKSGAILFMGRIANPVWEEE